MINTTIKYIVYTHTGGGVRHHHFGTQNNIIDEADGQASQGDTINALGFATLPFNGVNLPFAFMSVHGAADGNHLYTAPGNHPVLVGSQDIDILVVYAPVGGIGSGGGPGVWVDAFNVDTGSFSDSLDFIKVLTPPTPPDSVDAAKTTFANMEGEVSTLTAENIRANQTVDSVPFLKWKKIVPSETILDVPEIHLSQNESGEIWFAFYQTVSATIAIPDITKRMAQTMGKWVVDDYCGTPYPHHIGPHGPYPFQLSIKSSIIDKLGASQKEQLKGFIKEYPAVASSAYSEMTKVLAILNGVSNIISKTRLK
ncbi:MAG: hypothetical protein ACXV9R_04820 [Methylobacter sp.]